MQVADLLFCDYAHIDKNGKATLVGAGFTEIVCKQVPFTCRMLYVFIRLFVKEKDVGQNRVFFRIVGEKGPIFKAEINVNVKKGKRGEVYIPLSSQILNLKFDAAGKYDVEVQINGQKEYTGSIYVRKAS